VVILMIESFTDPKMILTKIKYIREYSQK
jgi:hypothetical protein